MNLNLESLIEYIHKWQTIDVKDQYGMEIDSGYGKCEDVYDSLLSINRNILNSPIRFIQANDTGDIEIFCDVRY